MIFIPGSSKCVKFLPFHQKKLPKGRIFTYLEDAGILSKFGGTTPLPVSDLRGYITDGFSTHGIN